MTTTGRGGGARWPEAVAALGFIFAVYAAASYFWAPFHEAVLATLELLVIALIATGSGRLALGLLGLSDISESQKTLIGASLGLGILSLLIFALGVGHLLYGWMISLMLAVLWLAGWTQMRQALASLTSNRNLLQDRPASTVSMVFLLGLVYWMTWIPPHQYDSLVYHLAMPQTYVQSHGLVPIPYLLFSHFPQNGEMLFTLALLMKSDLLAQMFMWLALTLSAWWIFEMGKREAPLTAVIISCLLLLSHTSVMLLSATSYVESLVMLWTTAAVLCFLRWHEVSAARHDSRSWLALSAVFSGLALGTKYYAGIMVGLLGISLLWRIAQAPTKERRSKALDFALFTMLTTLLFSPWLIRNALMVGNPIFPFFYRLFPMTGTGWNAQSAQGYFQVLTEYGHAGTFWHDVVSFPFLVLIGSPKFGGGMDILGRFGWDLVLLFLPVGIWAGWKNQFLRGLILFCVGYMAVWFYTGVVLRFLVALVPLLCLLSGGGIYALWKVLNERLRWALAGTIIILTTVHLALFLSIPLGYLQSAGVLLGLESRGEFLSRHLNYYPCADYATNHLGGNDKILIVGEQQSYYLPLEHVASTVDGPNEYALWANEAKNSADLARTLHQNGFSTLLVVPHEIQRLGLGALTPEGKKNWEGLGPYLNTAFAAKGCALLSLNAAPVASAGRQE